MMKKRVIGFMGLGLIVTSLLLSSLVNQPNAQDNRSVYSMGSSTPMPTATAMSYQILQPTQQALPVATMTVASQIIENRNQPNNQETVIQPKRIVIYSATLRIVADDPDITVDEIGILAEDLGGWIVNSNTNDRGNKQHYGTINIRVPAGQLAYVVDTIKGYAVSVTSEVISGDDVTNQYVDMASRLKNLQSSERQLQLIMEDAVNVDDVLATFSELTRIRGDIESIQGQLSYYDESSTFSSVSVNVDPLIPTPTPRVYVEPEWNPSDAVDSAFVELEHTTQKLIDDLIRVVIVGGPFALILLITFGSISGIGWTIWKARR